MDALKSTLEAIRAELDQFRKETTANFQVVKTQLNTVEFGVLTIAQSSWRRQSRMMRKVAG